jgi:hypothetical protein
MELSEINEKVHKAIALFYQEDSFLIENGLCERCLIHRLAISLEKQRFEGYFVDCEYNKSHLNKKTIRKEVSNPKGNYIDIVLTKRDADYKDDLTCFEVKKSTNYQGRKKDRDKLKILTNGKKFGFYIILSNKKEKTKIELYQRGNFIQVYSFKED